MRVSEVLKDSLSGADLLNPETVTSGTLHLTAFNLICHKGTPFLRSSISRSEEYHSFGFRQTRIIGEFDAYHAHFKWAAYGRVFNSHQSAIIPTAIQVQFTQVAKSDKERQQCN